MVYLSRAITATMAGLTLLSPALAVPAPANSPSSTKSSTSASATPTLQAITINNNFETDRNLNVVSIGSLSEIKVYNLLYWTLDLEALGVNGNVVAGVIPYTPNNVARFNSRTMSTNGPAMISANYETSTINSFTLSSTRYGCQTALPEPSAQLPVSCIITANAYDRAGNQLASQQFNYVYSGGQTQQMSYVTFGSGFERVYNVVFTVSNPDTTTALFDNTITTVYQ